MPTYEDIRNYLNTRDSFARLLGIEVLEAQPECGIASMPLDGQHRNGMGNAHGGALFSLVDMAFGAASCASGVYCVNAESNISYLAPGRIGPLRAEARQVHRGKHLGTYEVRVTDSDGTVVALARVTGFFTRHAIPDAQK